MCLNGADSECPQAFTRVCVSALHSCMLYSFNFGSGIIIVKLSGGLCVWGVCLFVCHLSTKTPFVGGVAMVSAIHFQCPRCCLVHNYTIGVQFRTTGS